MKRSRKGFSLIEVLIVLALSAVLVGLVGVSASMLARANVHKTANKLEKFLITARTTAMAKGDTEVHFNYHDNKVYGWINDEQPQLLGSGNIMAQGFIDMTTVGALLTTDTANSVGFTFRVDGSVGLTDGLRFVVADKRCRNCTEILVYAFTGKTAMKSLR
ncbi:MAG: prepilin-type N-terminal cleavage/methylation domain-containing protein [Lachnospiraceae bacterium]|nr:prepilin-type N-terminal cleavage/methylation domain-containing protein [Lachnospiraceae bacterium]